jgi:acylphosphatase
VQGVYFRQSTLEKALELGITGTVCNREDGTVEILAEGSKEQMKNFIDWCKVGPRKARVDRIDINEQPLKNFTGFIITF